MSDLDILPPVATRVLQRFREEFPRERPELFFAPGRVNLLGAHLDYNGGDVLPLAVDLGVYAAARLRGDSRITLRSLDQEPAVALDSAGIGPRSDEAHGWACYPIGVWSEFRALTGHDRGVDIVFGADLPIASGMSSSAAIEVATAVALDHLHGTGLAPEDLAMIGHRAETEFVGLRCGIMDQFASALGRPGHVLWLHCRDGSHEHVAIEGGGFQVLVMDTRKPRELAGSGFNERVRECPQAHQVLRRVARPLPHLADYGLPDLALAGEALEPRLRRRARHVVTEMVRVVEGVRALRDGDAAALGRCLDESHRSTSTDYEVSCDELDAITDAAREVDVVHGARLTGAGFGGCAIALVEPGRTSEVIQYVGRSFGDRFGVEPGFRVLQAGAGPRRLAV